MSPELRLSAGPDSIAVAPSSGGRLSSLVAGGRERILGRERARALQPDLYWGAYLMAPWPGRLDHGRYVAAGRQYQLDPVVDGHAIHGVAWMREWVVDAVGDNSIDLSCPLDGGGWPLGGRVSQRFTLAPGRLILDATIAGLTSPGPVGLGWHPWFLRPGRGDMSLRVPADHRLEVTEDNVPTGRLLPADGDWNLRAGPELGDRRLDVVYAGCRGPVEVGWPDLAMRIEWGPGIETVVVFTPEDGVCIEPQSMWPNAPLLAEGGHTGTGLAVIGPGEQFSVRETWTWG